MRTAIALMLGVFIGASGEFIGFAKAEKPEEKSAAEQMCFVLVRNFITTKCYWTP